ncbi:ATP-binding protein [Candidatus Omnitrophota bacterium]
MIISIASGKGGTGKTTVAVNLALSLKEAQLLDCDVEEPNCHIFLKPEISESKPAFIPVPEIDESKCNYCGECSRICVYNALAVIPAEKDKKGNVLVFAHLCHGCGVCSKLCPQLAIQEVKREIGVVEIGKRGELEFVHGKLNVGEAMSPPLIRQVKKQILPDKTVIIDAPPGTSCPVIASVKGSDFCILVTEPTPFGLNDLKLAVEVVRKLKIPFGVVVNRSDIGDQETDSYCEKEKIPVLAKIPFNKVVAIAYSKGIPAIEAYPGYKMIFKDIFEEVKKLI